MTSLIVVGEMNTDIVVSGLPRFPKAGELVNGTGIAFGPGGKARNIAAMSAALLSKGAVGMVSRTAKDKFGLWEEPLKALVQAGVNTDYVRVDEDSHDSPGFAIILVDEKGNNQIIGAPGITRHLGKSDVEGAATLLEEVGSNHGFMAFVGTCPLPTARFAVSRASELGMRVVFDPGGADDLPSLAAILSEGIFLVKPNEHEAEGITGVRVHDFETAQAAADKLRQIGAQNVLITAGSRGAYLFADDIARSIPAPHLAHTGATDETGCGDQVMAAVCAGLIGGKTLEAAAELGVFAGTMQFHRAGIKPLSREELMR